MGGDLIQNLQSLAPLVIGIVTLAALFLLWRARHSVWLMVAIVAELAGIAFRAVLFVAPELMRTVPLFFAMWTLSALVFAVALLGYAIEVTQRK
jgi:hypothetical protein